METIITLNRDASVFAIVDVLYSQQWLDIMCIVHLVDGSNQDGAVRGRIKRVLTERKTSKSSEVCTLRITGHSWSLSHCVYFDRSLEETTGGF